MCLHHRPHPSSSSSALRLTKSINGDENERDYGNDVHSTREARFCYAVQSCAAICCVFISSVAVYGDDDGNHTPPKKSLAS